MLDNIQREKNELNTLLDKGMEFKVGKRTFLIKQPCLGTLDHLSAEFIDMEFDEEKMQADPLGESKAMAKKLAKNCARVVAIAVLGRPIRISLLTRPLALYMYWNVTPSMLLQLVLIINTMCNFGDFINSIRLMSGARTTAPIRIEESVQA